ncbi:(p)ppGpp synthase/HD superfamily hydrolase [Streptomyces sp. SAI-208]|nr:(p)ppGpp synthase/HD superfamily hydrolase [Streptomyces sp. SAI-208]
MNARRRSATRWPRRRENAPSPAEVLAAVGTRHPHADLASVRLAHDEAAHWHAGQARRGGDPYVTHCLEVAAVVADMGMPPAVVCAALLHDIEDTPVPVRPCRRAFR